MNKKNPPVTTTVTPSSETISGNYNYVNKIEQQDNASESTIEKADTISQATTEEYFNNNLSIVQNEQEQSDDGNNVHYQLTNLTNSINYGKDILLISKEVNVENKLNNDEVFEKNYLIDHNGLGIDGDESNRYENAKRLDKRNFQEINAKHLEAAINEKSLVGVNVSVAQQVNFDENYNLRVEPKYFQNLKFELHNNLNGGQDVNTSNELQDESSAIKFGFPNYDNLQTFIESINTLMLAENGNTKFTPFTTTNVTTTNRASAIGLNDEIVDAVNAVGVAVEKEDDDDDDNDEDTSSYWRR
jgi:hypothetical protein